MKVERVIHQVWKEWNSMPKELKDRLYCKRSLLGKYQYIYTEGKIRISLVKLNNTMPKGMRFPTPPDFWEICGGGLTDDVEKFRTKKDAVKRIKELFNGQNR